MNPLSQRAWHTLLSPYWLIAALSAAAFFQFALDRGGVESAIWVAGFFLCVHVIAGSFDPKQLPRGQQIFLAAVGFLLLISWVFSPEATDTARTGRVIKFAILVLSVQYLAQMDLGRGLRIWVGALAVTIVLWQFAVRHLGGGAYGTFNNPHYIAYFMALLLPLLVLSASWLERPYRYLIYFVLLLDLELVFNELHSPAIPLLAIGAGFGAYAWSATGHRARWVVVGVAVAFAVAAAALINVPPRELPTGASAGDERVQLWVESLQMLEHNDARRWLVGNGIGSFRHESRSYLPPQFIDSPFPHNPVIELLYENGAVLTAFVAAFLAHLFWRSLRLVGSLADHELCRLAQCNLAQLLIWFVFSFLAFGVYSRYTLYPFGFILGIYFFLEQRADAVKGRLTSAHDAASPT